MQKLSSKILQEKSNVKHNNNYLIIGDYINNNTKILIKHLFCDTIFYALPTNHLQRKGCCPKCFFSKKKTKEELQKESNAIHNNEYEIIGEYVNTDTKIDIKHKICGNIFRQTPDKHLHNNKCPVCFGKNKLTKELLQEKSNAKYKGEYTILGNYINSYTPTLLKHNICNNEYKQTPNNHLRDRGCPFCYIPSKSEVIISKYLENNSLIFIRNKTFENCAFKRKLKYDFYLPEYNICIEYDGEQHFKPIDYFGGTKKFEIIKKRDCIKNKFCLENGIKLYRISYKENIINKLNNIFNI